MLLRQFRLPARERLQNTKTYPTPFFVCKIGKNNLPLSRFGFVVSKAVDKRAVVRNRSKRVLRSIIETALSNVTAGYDVLFIIRQPILERTTDLEESVQQIFTTAGLLKI